MEERKGTTISQVKKRRVPLTTFKARPGQTFLGVFNPGSEQKQRPDFTVKKRPQRADVEIMLDERLRASIQGEDPLRMRPRKHAVTNELFSPVKFGDGLTSAIKPDRATAPIMKFTTPDKSTHLRHRAALHTELKGKKTLGLSDKKEPSRLSQTGLRVLGSTDRKFVMK